MIFDPRTPVIIGTLLIAAVIGALTFESPLPAPLSHAHSLVPELSTLSGCERCHSDSGFAAGCLDCHAEISRQLAEGRGYHHEILADGELRCVGCHSEHHGEQFEMVNAESWGAQTRRGFKHDHVPFGLAGAHDTLQCEQCHRERLNEAVSLPAFPHLERKRTYLGVTQDCESCHQDIHSNGLSGECETCHGQDSFHPTVGFDHNDHFPLDGGHRGVACEKCHIISRDQLYEREFPFPFDHVQGTRCADCHQSPHRALFSTDCDPCHGHSEANWSLAVDRMSREVHDLTGFPLLHQHTDVDCRACHPAHLPFEERYPNPAMPGYLRSEDTCEGCHEDYHRGQFASRHDRCLDCHHVRGFQPTTFGLAAHEATWPLSAPHSAVACNSCHVLDASRNTTRFAETTQSCKVCHVNPHGRQFDVEIDTNDCTSCHTPEAHGFDITPFDHTDRTGYALEGAHARARCADCHVELVERGNERAGPVQRYRGTPRKCASCHHDVHRGQFDDYGEESCVTCHTSLETWSTIRFDHDTQTRFPLSGAHAEAECSRCHAEVPLDDGTTVVQYRPVGRECTDCHDILEATHAPRSR